MSIYKWQSLSLSKAMAMLLVTDVFSSIWICRKLLKCKSEFFFLQIIIWLIIIGARKMKIKIIQIKTNWCAVWFVFLFKKILCRKMNGFHAETEIILFFPVYFSSSSGLYVMHVLPAQMHIIELSRFLFLARSSSHRIWFGTNISGGNSVSPSGSALKKKCS